MAACVCMCVNACVHLCVCLRAQIPLWVCVPENEMMYARLNGVFHNAPSPDRFWQPRARSLALLCLSIKLLSGGKGLRAGEEGCVRAVYQFT